MCNNTQKKKAAGAGKDFTLFFGVTLHFNFKCASERFLIMKLFLSCEFRFDLRFDIFKLNKLFLMLGY